MNQQVLKSAIKSLIVKANTVLDKEVYDALAEVKDNDKKLLILSNCYLAQKTERPLCQDTGQVMVFIKMPFDFSFGYDFKSVINDAVKETYKENSYRKSVVKDAFFDRKNTNTNTPAIIYTEFEQRETVKIDVLIKGGGAENMSFIKMFNPTATKEEIINELSKEINQRGINACPPLFIGIGMGGTMDYAALLSKKALFEGEENEFCKKLKILFTNNNIELISIKLLTTSTHIASMPVGVTINCHSNRHAGCEIKNDKIKYNYENYNLIDVIPDYSKYKTVKIETSSNRIAYKQNETKHYPDTLENTVKGEKILFSGTVYTMRDMAHKKIAEMIKNNERLPFEIKNSVIFYAGPAPKKEDEIIGPIGPTTSKRMDKFAPLLYDLGCFATIGKGKRSKEVLDACKRNNAHYFSAQGGIACLLQKSVKKFELIAFEEFGTEAIYKLEVENLPLTVEI